MGAAGAGRADMHMLAEDVEPALLYDFTQLMLQMSEGKKPKQNC